MERSSNITLQNRNADRPPKLLRDTCGGPHEDRRTNVPSRTRVRHEFTAFPLSILRTVPTLVLKLHSIRTPVRPLVLISSVAVLRMRSIRNLPPPPLPSHLCPGASPTLQIIFLGDDNASMTSLHYFELRLVVFLVITKVLSTKI